MAGIGDWLSKRMAGGSENALSKQLAINKTLKEAEEASAERLRLATQPSAQDMFKAPAMTPQDAMAGLNIQPAQKTIPMSEKDLMPSQAAPAPPTPGSILGINSVRPAAAPLAEANTATAAPKVAVEATQAPKEIPWERGIGEMNTAKKGYETEFKFEDKSGKRISPADFGNIKNMEGVKLSARGIGSPEDIEKQKTINLLEKEAYAQFPSAEKMKLLAEAKGLKGITPYEQKTLAAGEKAAKTAADQFKSTHDLAVEKHMMEEFSKVAGTQTVKGQDALGNDITTTKVDPEMYQQAMVFGEGKLTPEAIKKTVQWKRQKTAVAQGLPLLVANKGDKKMESIIVKQLLTQGVPQAQIDSMLEQVKATK